MSSHHGSTSSRTGETSSPYYNSATLPQHHQQQQLAPPPEPRRLELSLDPETGSLLTAPLTHVLLTATDNLYTDLYNMAHGELHVTTTAETDDPNNNNNNTTTTTKLERMSNLSFAQRRHELAWRLARHSQTLQQVSALTAGSHEAVTVARQSLQHARAAWVQADEAQDALYFFHAQLFPSRSAPHDIYGACDVLQNHTWYDLASNLQLPDDAYERSEEAQWTSREVDDRWQLAVRRKLVQEVSQQQQWHMSLRGGVVRLTHGQGKREATNESTSALVYPMEALLTVLNTQQPEWKLLSLNIRVQAKTGEFNYQLETSKRQQLSLHRLASSAMTREEKRGTRPLQALFQVAQRFSLSWQLNVLSAQALALQRGVWAATKNGTPIEVQPAEFFDDNESDDDRVLGYMSISFWKVEDAFGPPAVADLNPDTEESRAQSSSSRVKPKRNQQLALLIRAETNAGICVSLSGAASILSMMSDNARIKATVQNVLEATSNPFALSASDALLAACTLCAERKCHAVVEALQRSCVIPSWISVSVEHESIVVKARMVYYGLDHDDDNNNATNESPTLFRLMCDVRTGTFVPTFSRTLYLLRHLACSDLPRASEPATIRIAHLNPNRRNAASAHTSGRVVRDTFGSLVRSLNVLGNRVGVGGTWDDDDPVESPVVRQRDIQAACKDVRTTLEKCCALSALFGVAAVAMNNATGLMATPDMSGKPLEKIEDLQLLAVPPLSVRLANELIEASPTTREGVSRKVCYVEEDLFSLSCFVRDDGIVLVPLEISIKLESPSSYPYVQSCDLLRFHVSGSKSEENAVNGNGKVSGKTTEGDAVLSEASKLSDLLTTLIEENDE